MLSIFVGLTDQRGGELQQLRAAFDHFDIDNDGKINIQELLQAEKALNAGLNYKWKEIVIKCDLDGDGALDYHEFLTGAIDHKKMLTGDNLRRVFELFDTNKDGQIEVHEFQQAMPKSRPIDKEQILGRAGRTSGQVGANDQVSDAEN